MMIWAIADLHLALSVPEKSMEAFGSSWRDYTARIEAGWRTSVSPEDLVLIPGDISWAMKPEEALIDLAWIDALPGKKVILRGNHDYWWPSSKKLREMLPPSLSFIRNNALTFGRIAIGGTRLWDSPEYDFKDLIANGLDRKEDKSGETEEEFRERKASDLRIFERELERLKLSLSKMDRSALLRIAMTHYPPIGHTLEPSRTSAILETYGIDICLFGHLHNVKRGQPLFGKRGNVSYILTAADYLDFTPILIHDRETA
ncbi:MAG: metallophosphoesterase [Simkaniaceae bacterium]|nr:metallophosphoesterase [Simkaniaceae bacterium]